MAKLFVFGCSFTRDNYQQVWPDILVRRLKNFDLVNCAERGAGADYVTRRLLTTSIDHSQDLVVILWPSADRYDLWIDRTVPHLQADLDTASWPDGHRPYLVDYDGTRSSSQGFLLNGSQPRGYKNYFFKYFYSANQAANDWLINLLAAQFYLQSQNIAYVMATAFPISNPIHYHHDHLCLQRAFVDKVMLDRFVDGSYQQGFYHFCQQSQLPFYDPHHPATAAHEHWVDQLLWPKILDLKLISA